METILICDTETTGTDDNATAIEVACTLYSVANAAPIRSFASLIRASSNPAEPVNRIPANLLLDAPTPGNVWHEVKGYARHAGAIVAHNADFDRRFVPAEVTGSLPWICSMDDLQWPQAGTGNSLIALALAHGVGVASAHRAMADCDLLARLLTRVAEMGTDLGAMLARGLRPKATYQALVSYESNHLAKSAGFRWDAGARMWARKMAIEDAAELPFKVRMIAEGT